jgi:hypothetical protein
LGKQEIVSEVAASLSHELEEALMTRGIEEVLVVAHAPRKYARKGAPYLVQVISAVRDRQTGAGDGERGVDAAKQKVVRWLSHEISTRASNGIVDFTVNKITSSRPQGSQASGGETTVESSLTVQLPTWSERESVVVTLGPYEVAKIDSVQVKVTGEFDGEVVMRLQEGGARAQSVEFKDCALKITASFPWGIHRSFSVPIRGALVA